MESVKWQCKENGKSDKASVIRWVGTVKLYSKQSLYKRKQGMCPIYLVSKLLKYVKFFHT